MPLGFTLTELLAVISIIGILAALVLPALSRARQTADSAVCQSNLHHWGLGLRMYVDDCSGYPTDRLAIGATNDNHYWYDRLQPYAGAKWPHWDAAMDRFDPTHGIAVCPAYSRLPNPAYGFVTNYFICSGSYAYNGKGMLGLVKDNTLGPWDIANAASPDPTVRECDIVRPSEMIAIGDAVIFSLPGPSALTMGPVDFGYYKFPAEVVQTELGLIPLLPQTSPNVPASIAKIRRRHAGQFIVLFCDGHAVNSTPQRLWDVRQDSVCRQWNRDNRPHREMLAGWPLYLP